MPELYIGNVTKQIHQFAYRALERPGIVLQTIPIGGQIRVSPDGKKRDMTIQEIDYILDQHKTYGLISAEEINSKHNGPFNGGLVYSIGKPLTPEKLHQAMLRKENALGEFGKKLRQEAALAVNSQIEEQIGAPLKELEMSFVEEEPRGGYTTENPVGEGIRVTRLATEGPPVAETGRRRRA
jgi:hypothetical protein